MICKFSRVRTKFLGPVNQWARERLDAGGDATHYGYVVDTGEMVWVFPLREDGTRLALVFAGDGTVKSNLQLSYTDEELEKGYKLLCP